MEREQLNLGTHTIPAELYEQLNRFARRRGAPADAEDVVHDVMVRVLVGRFDRYPAEVLRPILYRSVANRLTEIQRGNRRLVGCEVPPESGVHSFEDSFIRTTDIEIFLDGLGPEQRAFCEAIMQLDAETRTEIAATLGLSRDQLYRRLRKLELSPRLGAHRPVTPRRPDA